MRHKPWPASGREVTQQHSEGLADGHAKSEQGAQVMVSFHVIKSAMAGLSSEIDECTDGAEALTAYDCHRFEVSFSRIGETMENQNIPSPQSKLIIEQAVSDGGTPTLVCRGRITMETASQFRSEIKTLAPRHKFLKADLGGIDFVDSEGLGSILGTYIFALSYGCELMLVNVNSRVKDLLNITHLEAVFGNRT